MPYTLRFYMLLPWLPVCPIHFISDLARGDKWKGVLDCAYVIICVLDWDHRSAQL